MQKIDDGTLVFSASDLSTAEECLWAQVRRIDKALGFEIDVPKNYDPMLVRAGKLGDAHELKKLEEFRIKFGDGVIEIPRPSYENSEASMRTQLTSLTAQTLEALREKRPVVFQATFFDGEFQGFADFLVLNSDGEYSVYDTKLARKAKITALMQLAAYAHQLKQNGIPTSNQVHLILGDQSVSSHNLDDILPTFMFRRNSMKRLISERKSNQDANGQAVAWGSSEYPACGRCVVCEPHVAENDDLLLVAGMRLDQRSRLMQAGINTATELATTSLTKIPEMTAQTFEGLRGQARIQHSRKNRDSKLPPPFEVIDRNGLSALPPKSPGDIFFDFEGDPLYQEGVYWNLDYLFGYVDENSKFDAIWAHSIAGEKIAFQKFCNVLRERLKKTPDMHVYHYASYEKSHLLSLAARHGIEEEFIDELLRKNVLVDLYPIVRRSILVGAASYSLKKIEAIYFDQKERKGVSTAVDSVVEYANYRELVDSHQLDEAQAKLREIELYNTDDCVSTLLLRNWLLGLAERHEVPLLGGGSLEDQGTLVEHVDPLVTELTALIADVEIEDRTPDQTAIALTAAAIDFHRREDKSFWWAHYDRLDSPIDEWQSAKDIHIINSAEIVATWHMNPPQRKVRRHLLVSTTPTPGSYVKAGVEFFAVYPNSCVELPEPSTPGSRRTVGVKVLEVIDESTFVIEELVSGNGTQHDYIPLALTPGAPPRTEKIQAAIKGWGQRVLASYPELERNPALDILRRQSPVGGKLPVITSKNAADSILETLLEMRTGTLAVQGPPGSGKSHNGGHVIADLVLKHGWKVGVISQSHASIENLLRAVSKAGVPAELVGKAIPTGQTFEAVRSSPSTTWTPIAKDGYSKFTSERQGYVIGGTVFDFVKPDQVLPESLDLLVIDEAGQYSLANTIAASTAAKRMLLLGDPQQLPQVTQGKHPEPIDGSALGWLTGEHEVIPGEFGYFLPDSWRMEREVCKVVSDNFYDSQLGSAAPMRKLEGINPGFFPISISHHGNSTESIEEAEKVVELVEKVIHRAWTDKGETQTLADSKENIIVVAPYNAQVQLIRKHLDAAGFEDIPVGTVDKFQGQEAAVAIVSMTASSAIDVPRGIEFLLMPNRLNVGISRAKWASYLIYSQNLLDYKPTNLENLKLLSRFLNLVRPDLTLRRHE